MTQNKPPFKGVSVRFFGYRDAKASCGHKRILEYLVASPHFGQEGQREKESRPLNMFLFILPVNSHFLKSSILSNMNNSGNWVDVIF